MIAPVRALRRPQGGIAGLWLILVIAAAVFAPLLTPYAYDVQDLPNAYQPASAAHWLGTDEFGRDLLTRLIYGARTSLSVSATAIAISVVCGMVLGAAAAWFGGWLDRIVTVVVDLTWSFPEILIALILVAIIGNAAEHSTAVLVGRLTTDVILQRLGQETPADFIKIDVEGGELSVLEGLRGHFVTQDHPRRLLVEVHSEDLGQQCRQFLTQYQYEVTEMRHPGYVYDSPNWRMHYWLLAVREPKGNPS